MMFACLICDILVSFARPELSVIILGDVTYGACCVDDISSATVECVFLVTYWWGVRG